MAHYLIASIETEYEGCQGYAIVGPFDTASQARAYGDLLPAIDEVNEHYREYQHVPRACCENLDPADEAIDPYFPFRSAIDGTRLAAYVNREGSWQNEAHRQYHVDRKLQAQTRARWIAYRLMALGVQPPDALLPFIPVEVTP